jgi:type II secretory ATPase GspE/PulE/Tfp pilus assembly ATPase PilB-like protein
VDLGIEPYMVASTVEAVLAQRLVRRVCPACREAGDLTSEQRAAFGSAGAGLDQVWRGVGCSECRSTGYRGRTGIYELLVMDDEVRAAVQENVSASRLEALGVAQGMRLLKEDGIRMIREGHTTPEEVLRVANV